MTRNKRRIIALLVRFDNAYSALEERMAEAYDRDSAFDGGEFSGPALHREMMREGDALARRFGFADACLVDRIACLLNVPRVENPFREPFIPDLCIYCTSAPVDNAHAPYCGTICAIDAEVDSVD